MARLDSDLVDALIKVRAHVDARRWGACEGATPGARGRGGGGGGKSEVVRRAGAVISNPVQVGRAVMARLHVRVIRMLHFRCFL
jgi:hypothetical protein